MKLRRRRIARHLCPEFDVAPHRAPRIPPARRRATLSPMPPPRPAAFPVDAPASRRRGEGLRRRGGRSRIPGTADDPAPDRRAARERSARGRPLSGRRERREGDGRCFPVLALAEAGGSGGAVMCGDRRGQAAYGSAGSPSSVGSETMADAQDDPRRYSLLSLTTLRPYS